MALAVTAVALVALVIGAVLLYDSQSHQRDDLRSAYGQRAEIATGAVESIFRVGFVGQSREAAQRFDEATPSREDVDAAARANDATYLAVLDPSGEVLAASSGAPEGLRRRLATVPDHVRAALRADFGLSNVLVNAGEALVESAVVFETPFGRRVQLSAAPIETYVGFLSGTLVRLPRVADGGALVLDANGRILGSAGYARRLRTPPAAVTGSAMEGTFDGQRGPTYFRAERLPGTDWRIVIAAPERNLFASVGGLSRWLPWVLLALGVGALVAIGLLLRRLMHTASALGEANADLARSNRDLEQFAYVASHDLSEPLRTVAGFSQLLGKRYAGRLDAEADLYIEHMVSGVDRMQQLIDDLLMYSRVGRQPVRAERVDLDEVLGEVLAAIDPFVRERDAQITSDDLPVVAGERSQLGQVLQNLIANAIKFTAPDVTPRVHVGATRRGGLWEVFVRDNGIGVDANPEVIFNMFARLHPADAYPGTGIGLALVKRIMERHDGDVRVEPAPGGGSVFTISLPDRAPVPISDRVQTPA
jgi:signal transduction histidine kinase